MRSSVQPLRAVALLDDDPARELRRLEHDGQGNLRSITEIDGARTTIALVGGSGPARAMPASIVGPDGAVTRVAYDTATGTVRSVARDATGPSPVLVEMQSDAAGRPTWTTSPLGSVTDLRGATQVAATEWELPLDGVPRRSWSQRGGAIENRTFAIDPAGRLSAEQATSPAAFQLGALDLPAAATSTALASMTAARTSYALDGRNNWTSRTSAGVTTSYAQDARDALLAIGSQAVATEALGAITDDGTHRYTYDALGLVAEVRPLGTSGGRRYQRDALGRVVAETDLASGAVTRFAWDGAQRVFVQRPTGAIETTLAAEGLDQPVVTIFPGGARRYFHQDRQGSVYAQTDDAGVAQPWLSYSAYGEVSLLDAAGRTLPATGVLPSFGYHGLPHDFGLGLVDMRARVYRPSLGRFLSPDPIKLGGGANLFAFVNSGPLTWRDPWGLSSRDAEGAFARVQQQASAYLAERIRSEPPVPMGDWLQRSYQQKWIDLGHTGNLLSLARFGDESAIRELDDEALRYCGYVGDSESSCRGVTSDILQQRATQDAFGIVGASPVVRGASAHHPRLVSARQSATGN